MKDLSMTISMKCRVCGNDQFSALESDIVSIDESLDETIVKCSDCGRECSKAELLEDNQHIIDANVEDLKDEAFKQIEKELKKMFK